MAEPSQHGGGPTAPRINNVRLFSRLLGSSSSSSSSAHRKWGSNDDGDDVRPPRTRKNDDNGRRRHRRDSDDGGGGGSSAVSDPGDSADEDSSGMFEVCETVDDSMFGLHPATIDGAAVAGSEAPGAEGSDPLLRPRGGVIIAPHPFVVLTAPRVLCPGYGISVTLPHPDSPDSTTCTCRQTTGSPRPGAFATPSPLATLPPAVTS